MNDGALQNIYARVTYLTACTLADKCPDTELLSDIDIEKVYLAAKRHNMSALVAEALEKVGLATDGMRADTHRAVRKIMLLDAERREILAELERRGIWYMPLKGAVIKELYPKIGLREMSDNDILFDEAYRETVRDIFCERGYDIRSYGKDKNHDTYLKEPVYNYEMHVSLFGSFAVGEKFTVYFDSAAERALSDGTSRHGFRMTDEDFYIYIKAHEYKHYLNAGTGLRLFADTYVYRFAKSGMLDFGYINEICEKIGISDFEGLTASLSMKLMDVDTAARICRGEDGVLTDEETLLFAYCSGSGAYGFVSQSVENGIKKLEKEEGGSSLTVKIKYIWRRLFPQSSYYRTYYPFAYKQVWARPFVLVWRFFRVLFTEPKTLITSILTVIRHKGKEETEKQ